MIGRVLKSTGSWYEVLLENGDIIECRTRGKLRLEGFETTNPVAVGDLVETEEKEKGSCQIMDILPRKNYIIRKSIKKKSQSHIIAANMDLAALVVTMALPRTSTGFIDRFLVTAEAYDIPQMLIFNKTDILKKKDREKMEYLKNTYSEIGIICISTSAVTGEGIDDLKEKLKNKITLISGHSGVGKSSLLNLLAPEVNQEVKEISKWTEKGMHTTTFAEMFATEEETYVIDTPGIKELGLVEMEPEEISDYFPEMRKAQKFCRFNNCTHTHEPGCAVKEALEKGEIEEFRYHSYLSILDDEESHR
ncbi:MAG: ribosome small subunit-dependent GTPase A [Candidatus Cyclobacteriaceae bacterium M2_1C_046]